MSQIYMLYHIHLSPCRPLRKLCALPLLDEKVALALRSDLSCHLHSLTLQPGSVLVLAQAAALALRPFAEQQTKAIEECLQAAAAMGDGEVPLRAAAELIELAEKSALAKALDTSLLKKPTLESLKECQMVLESSLRRVD